SWFVMENVTEAPSPIVGGYSVKPQIVRDVWCGGETNRLRRFCFGSRLGVISRWQIDTLALSRPDPEHSALASGGGRPVPVALGGSGKPKISAKRAVSN